MKKKNEATISVKTTVSVPLRRVQDLLCSAFEGGYSPWYFITKFVKPRSMPNKLDGEHVYRHIDYPVNPGGAVMLVDQYAESELDNSPVESNYPMPSQVVKGWKPKTKVYRLDLAAVTKGLQVMAEKEPIHFANLLSEDDDAITGDVFLQCCVFGQVIYG